MRLRAFCIIFALAALTVTQSFAASYTIDVIVPETGNTGAVAATYQQWRQAAQLASADVADLWASTGDTLTVQILDNQNAPALNIQQASSSTAIAVIGAGSDVMTEQAALALQSRGIPLLAPTLRKSVDSSIDNLFTLMAPYEYSENVTVDIMRHFGWDKIGLLYGRDEESVALRKAFKAQPGIRILAELELPSDVPVGVPAAGAMFSEFQAQLARFTIASNNIYVISWRNSGAMIPFLYASEVATGLNGLTKAWLWMNVPEESIKGIPHGNFIYRPSPGSPESVGNFTENLRTFTSNPTLVLQKDSMFVYDAVMMAASAIRGGATTSTALRDSLRTMVYEGATGSISYDASGHRKHQRFEILNQVPRANYSATIPNPYNPYSTLSVLGTTRYTQPAFLHDHNGLTVNGPAPIWPGFTYTPTPGNFTTWPIAFMSRLPSVPTYGVPMTRGDMILYGRWIMDFLNERSGFLPPFTRLSMPPIDDSGTAAGAVRSAAIFPTFGFVGVVGSDTTEISVAIQNIVSAYSMPQISHGGTASFLSDKTDYPSFFRTVGSDNVQMIGLARLAISLGWDNIAVISTSGTYGSDLVAAMTSAAAATGLKLAAIRTFAEGTDVDAEVKAFSEEGHYVVAVLADPRDVLKIRQSAKELGYNPRAWLVPARFMNSDLSLALPSYPGLSVSDFDGFVGLAPGLRTDYPGFNTWWTALHDSVTGAPGQVRNICSVQTLYCAFVYDSIMTMANGVKLSVLAGDSPRNATAFMNHLRSVDVSLATGRISFDQNQDRVSSTFSVLNRQAGQLVQVGDWSEGSDPSYSNIIWPDGTTNVPQSSDPPKLKFLEWKSAPAIVLAILAGLGLVLVLALFIAVWVQSASPIIRTATWEFLLVILFGCALGYGSMFTWIGQPRDWICALRIWLPPMSYVIVLAPLLAKTWRLHKIFTLGSLKVVPIPFWKLCLIASAVILVQIIICIVWISIGTIQPMLVASKNERNTYFVVCAQKQANQILAYITYAYCGVITFAGAYLAFIVRKLPKDFNESRWIGFSMYNSLIFGAIILVLGYSLREFVRTVYILICAITLALVTGVLVFMFFPKMWDLIRHPEKRSGSGSTRKTTPTNFNDSNGESDNRSYRRHDYSKKTSFNHSSEMDERKSSSRETSNGTRRHDYSLRKESGSTPSDSGKASKKNRS